ncbi:hypothetical protein LSAT2_000378 [Lamellibrachia satsuma]|nr:hypothetical protein LSAT2_000378 [Lamellibrachia satsuma]
MSGIRRNKPAGRFGRHGVRLPTRLAPITKPSKALSAVWDAGTPSLELIGKSTPEGDILTPTVSQDQFEGSCKDLLLDLGNGPAQAIIDQNARTLAQRVADETREELARVLERVELIYGQFELSESLALKNAENNLEYVNDMAELEELINDQVKKKKGGRKEMRRKEMGGKTNGSKERGVGESVAKDSGGQEMIVKAMGGREMGGKVSGGKTMGVQVSQVMGGKGDRLMSEREPDNSLPPSDKAAGQNMMEGIHRKSYSEAVIEGMRKRASFPL